MKKIPYIIILLLLNLVSCQKKPSDSKTYQEVQDPLEISPNIRKGIETIEWLYGGDSIMISSGKTDDVSTRVLINGEKINTYFEVGLEEEDSENQWYDYYRIDLFRGSNLAFYYETTPGLLSANIGYLLFSGMNDAEKKQYDYITSSVYPNDSLQIIQNIKVSTLENVHQKMKRVNQIADFIKKEDYEGMQKFVKQNKINFVREEDTYEDMRDISIFINELKDNRQNYGAIIKNYPLGYYTVNIIRGQTSSDEYYMPFIIYYILRYEKAGYSFKVKFDIKQKDMHKYGF